MSVTLQTRRQTRIIIVMLAAALAFGTIEAAGETWSGWSRDDRDPWSPRSGTLERRGDESRSGSFLSGAEAAGQLSSPENITKTVKNRVQYSRDMLKDDEWRSGRETWDRGEGDCEDYAATVKDLCAANGIVAHILVVRSRAAGKSHAVTMGEWNGGVWVSSNGSYREFQSLHDAKQEVARDLGWWAPEVEVFKVEQSATGDGRRYVPVATDGRHPQTMPHRGETDVFRTLPCFPAESMEESTLR